MTRPFTRRLLAVLATLAMAPGLVRADEALPPRDPQTIAQTVVDLDGQPLRWTVSMVEAGDGATADGGRPALLLGASGRVAVDGSAGPAMLDPGEGYAVPQGGGARLEPGSGDGGVAWLFGLRAPVLPDPDGAVLVSDPFSASGPHELVLVRDVLAPRESAPLSEGALPLAVLATDGLATILSPGSEAVSLSPGSAAALEGDATVTAGEGGATIVAAALLPVEPAATATATPSPVADAPESGAISLDLYACGPLATLPRIPAGACERADPGVDFQVFELGSGGNRRGMGEATVGEGRVLWTGLPDGEYLLNALSLPDGYARFYVPGLQGVNSPPERGYTAGPNEGYLLPIGPQQGRTWAINVYLIPGDAAADGPVDGSADVVIRFRECPAGVVAEPEMTGRGCQPVAPPASMILDLVDPAGGAALGWDDAEPTDALSRTWRGVPAGDWLLTGELDGVFGFAVRSSDPALEVALKPDRSAYDVTLRPGDGPAFMDIYLLQEP